MFVNPAFFSFRPLVVAPPPTPGTPPAIAPSSLRVWLEADQKVYNTGTTPATNGQTVSSWAGLGTTTATASANTGTAPAPTLVTNVVNGLPVVRFSSQALYFGNILTGWPAGSIFVVCKNVSDPGTDTTQAGAPIQNWGSYNFYFSHWPYTDGTFYDAFGTTDRKTLGNPTPSLASQFRVVTVRSKASLYDFRIDGASVYSTTTNTVGWGTNPRLGRGDATYTTGTYSVTWWPGDIFAIVACNAYLSDADAGSMESYLLGRIGDQTPPPSDGNDTRETATDLGTLVAQTQLQHNGTFTAGDTVDWFKFTVTADLSGNFILSNMSANCDMYFHGYDGSEWQSSTNSGTTVENFGTYLYAGTYWVRVVNVAGGPATYTLTIEGS